MSIPLGVQAALISAATAAVVTLLVEYAAKPRLEARKDRVVEEYRNLRAVQQRIVSLLAMSSRMTVDDGHVYREESKHLKFEVSVLIRQLFGLRRMPIRKVECIIEILERALPYCRSSPTASDIAATHRFLRLAYRAWKLSAIRWRRPFARFTVRRMRALIELNSFDPADNYVP